MKTIYVTYKQLGIPKKGKIDEARYATLRDDQSITDLIAYPNELIMENNYRALTASDGTPGTKNVMFG